MWEQAAEYCRALVVSLTCTLCLLCSKKSRLIRVMLKCFAETGNAVQELRRFKSECRPKIAASTQQKTISSSFAYAQNPSFTPDPFFHVNPLPQVNSIKNRELNAKLTVVQKQITFPVISTKERAARKNYE